MARTLLTYIATYIVAVNVMLSFVGTSDAFYFAYSGGNHLFRTRIAPAITYDILSDAQNKSIVVMNGTEYDENSVKEGVQRAVGIGPNTGDLGLIDSFLIIKNVVVLVVNFFVGAIIGIPVLIHNILPEYFYVLSPFWGVLVIITIMGILDVFRGTSS